MCRFILLPLSQACQFSGISVESHDFIAKSHAIMATQVFLVGSMFAVRMSANAFLMNMGEADLLPAKCSLQIRLCVAMTNC